MKSKVFQVLALGLLALPGCCPYSSLKEAILAQEKNGVVAPGQYVLVPISNAIVLGYEPTRTPTPEDEKNRVLQPAAAPCFFVTPTSSAGLSDIKVVYSSNQTLHTELDATMAKLGLDLGSERNATLKLSGLKVLRGIGALNINACPITASRDYQIFTTLVQASTLSLDFDNKLKLNASVRVPIPQAGGLVNVGASGGSATGETATMIGKDIILSGTLTKVHIDVASKDYVLGSDPAPASYDLPAGFTGSVVVRRQKTSEDYLTVSLQVPTGLQGAAPEGVTTCKLGAETKLDRGIPCLYWLAPGNVQITLDWDTEHGTDAKVLHARAYRTSFAQGI